MRVLKPLLILIASAMLATTAAHAQEARPKPVSIAEATPAALPALEYINAAGKTVKPDFSKAKLTVLHFWATWCVPCVQELPEVDAVQREFGPRGLQVLALSLDGAKMQRIVEYYKSRGITHLAPAYDKNSAALRALKGMGVPISIFVNREGQEVARAAGVVAWESEETRDFLNKHLK